MKYFAIHVDFINVCAWAGYYLLAPLFLFALTLKIKVSFFRDHPFKIIKSFDGKMTDLEKQDPVETARLTTGEESNECYTKDELLSK